jgi:diaminopimelate epimerase
MRLEFTKMHGLGNDFLVLDTRAGQALPTAEDWQRLAQRHTGIGFDQALVLEPPKRANTAVFYRIFNADGSEVEQCGNGARCIAAYLHRHGRIAAGDFVMDSPGGLIRAEVHDPSLVSVDMGVPNFDPRSLPFEASTEAQTYALRVGDEAVDIGAVSIGNPHAVLTVPSAASAPVEHLGPAIEAHARFPRRVNVGFMEVIDSNNIKLRVFEWHWRMRGCRGRPTSRSPKRNRQRDRTGRPADSPLARRWRTYLAPGPGSGIVRGLGRGLVGKMLIYNRNT